MVKKKSQNDSKNHSSCIVFIARISLALIFAMSLYGKVTGFSKSASFAGSSWIPLPGELLIIAAIAMLVFGVFALVSGWKMKEGAYVLMLYTFLATIMFHVGEGQAMAFLKNLALFGGLLALSELPPGKHSLNM